MTAYQPTAGKWRDDPARDVVEELYHDLSEDLGTDGPEATFGHPRAVPVGRLVEDDLDARAGHYDDTLAWDSHDVDALTAEEAAMHLVDDEELDRSAEEAELPRAVRAALRSD